LPCVFVESGLIRHGISRPFAVYCITIGVMQSSAAQYCTASGDGLLSVATRVHSPNEFVIVAKDAAGAPLKGATFQIEVKSKSRECSAYTLDRSNGTYLVSYTPTFPDDYTISVALITGDQAEPIQGSPFAVTISPPALSGPPLKFVAQFGSYGSEDGQLNAPSGITVSADGEEVYICDTDFHRIQVFSKDGKFLRKFGEFGAQPGQMDRPCDVSLSPPVAAVVVSDPDSKVGSGGQAVYVCDQNDRVQVFSPDGTFKRLFGSKGSNDAEFDGPCGVAVSDDGRVWVCDRNNHAIKIYNTEGKFITKVVLQGALFVPARICYSATNKLFYVCDEGDDNCIRIFRSDTSLARSIGAESGSDPGQFEHPHGVAVTADGARMVVADYNNHRLQVFSQDGICLSQVGTEGMGPSEFYGPSGVAVAASGRVYVCEEFNHRVQIFEF